MAESRSASGTYWLQPANEPCPFPSPFPRLTLARSVSNSSLHEGMLPWRPCWPKCRICFPGLPAFGRARSWPLVYGLIGIALLPAGYWLFDKITPQVHVQKEL